MAQGTGVASDPGYGEADPLGGRARSVRALVEVQIERDDLFGVLICTKYSSSAITTSMLGNNVCSRYSAPQSLLRVCPRKMMIV